MLYSTIYITGYPGWIIQVIQFSNNRPNNRTKQTTRWFPNCSCLYWPGCSCLQNPIVVYFDKPAKRLYFSLIAWIVAEMKNPDSPGFIYIRKYEKILKLLDNSPAGKNGIPGRVVLSLCDIFSCKHPQFFHTISKCTLRQTKQHCSPILSTDLPLREFKN